MRSRRSKTSITVWGIWLGPRLPLAHRHGRDADDDVQPAPRRPQALRRCCSLSRSRSSTSTSSCSRSLGHRSRHRRRWTAPSRSSRCSTVRGQGREFFDDDPLTELQKPRARLKRLHGEDAWDAYPVVGYLLDIWNITDKYVRPVVDDLYTSDDEVASDTGTEGLDGPRAATHRSGNVAGTAGDRDARRAHRGAHEPPLPSHRARRRRASTRRSTRRCRSSRTSRRACRAPRSRNRALGLKPRRTARRSCRTPARWAA